MRKVIFLYKYDGNKYKVVRKKLEVVSSNTHWRNNNSIDKIDLTKEQINILCNDKDILYLYPDIKELIIF